MPGKYKNLYLYLALACFLGIILIFVFDGYIGLYDTVTITSNEQTTEITADQWQEQAKFGFMPQTSVNYGGKVSFSYEIDNRQFSAYAADVNVSVWQNQEKVAGVLSKSITVKAFGKERVDWTLDTAEYIADVAANNNSFTVVIHQGKIERKVIVYVYPGENGSKIITIPPPPVRN
jgi:hypothetical protein